MQTPPRTPQSAAARARLGGGGDDDLRPTFDRNKGRTAREVVSPDPYYGPGGADLRLVDVDGGGAEYLAAATSPVVRGLWRQALNRTAAIRHLRSGLTRTPTPTPTPTPTLIRHLRSVLDDKGKGEHGEEKWNEGEVYDDDDDDQAVMRHLRRNMARDADGGDGGGGGGGGDGTRIPHRLSPRHLRRGGPGSTESAGYDDEDDTGSGGAPLASLQTLRAEMFESQALAAAARNRAAALAAARRGEEVARHIPLSYRGKSLNRRASEGSWLLLRSRA